MFGLNSAAMPLEVNTHTSPEASTIFAYSRPPAITVRGVEIHVVFDGASAPMPEVVALHPRGAYTSRKAFVASSVYSFAELSVRDRPFVSVQTVTYSFDSLICKRRKDGA